MNLPRHPPTHYNVAWSSHELTSDAFLQVARTLHEQGKSDPEVQVALGTLFYSNADFEKAKDCFESALHSRPDVCLFLSSDVLALTYFGRTICYGTDSGQVCLMVQSRKKH